MTSLIRHVERSRTLNATVITLLLAGLAIAWACATLALRVETPGVRIVLGIAAIGTFVASAVLAYARFIEPLRIVITHVTVALPMRTPLRIALVGDFHLGPYKREAFVAQAVQHINALSPDLVLLVGDFLFDERTDFAHMRPLANLHARCGVYAVVGNHDSGTHHLPGLAPHVGTDRSDALVATLEPLGIRFLRNTSTAIDVGDDRLFLAGIDDIWMQSCNLERALRDVPRAAPCILLSHNPDIILDPLSQRTHLIVSGHTHGGQVRLPWYGPVTELPQRLNKKFDRGVHTITDACTLVITHGIGENFLPLRLLARPEVVLITATPDHR